MGSDQWVSIILQNNGGSEIRILDLKLTWGKLFSGDESNEISKEDVDGTVVYAGNSFTVSSSGREDSPTGTEGHFTVVDTSSGSPIATIKWHCPFIRENRFEVSGEDPAWIVQNTDVPLKGALGEIVVTFSQ